MNNIEPPLRWVGGKRSLAPQIMTRIPKTINLYVEPFIGGGTIFLEVLARKAAQRYLIADINPHLINMWINIRDHYPQLLDHLQEFKTGYDALPDMDAKRERYYWFRNEFNNCPLSPRHAALFLTLNRTAFNALVRYNGKGNFNSAFGKRQLVALSLENLTHLHHALNSAPITFQCGDFSSIDPTTLQPGDFVYLDPPYHVLGTRKIDDKTYSKEGFVDADEQRLREFCDRINEAGSYFLMSNHECPEILECFRGYPYEKVICYKSFTGKASSRSETKEILLGNGLTSTQSISCIGDCSEYDLTEPNPDIRWG